MSAVESAIEEYKRNSISKDPYLKVALEILSDFYNEINKDQGKLLSLIREKGGDGWIYDKIPLSDRGGYSLFAAISMNKWMLKDSLHKKGFEGITLYLDVNSIDIILRVSYHPINSK